MPDVIAGRSRHAQNEKRRDGRSSRCTRARCNAWLGGVRLQRPHGYSCKGDLSARPMPCEMLAPKGGDRDERSTALLMMTPYKATFIGILPNREAGA